MRDPIQEINFKFLSQLKFNEKALDYSVITFKQLEKF
jgi:hypothetical protein